MGERQSGVCKWFDRDKGYGFITPDNSQNDVFLHHSDLTPDEKETFTEGTRVTFETQDNQRGTKAVNIQRA